MNNNNKQSGSFGEELASSFLIQKGFSIIKNNYRYGKGEIDLIASINNWIVFIEVKYRKNEEFGSPLYSVTKNKQAQIRKIAAAYLAENNIPETDCRFDVVSIVHLPQTTPRIEHIENAF